MLIWIVLTVMIAMTCAALAVALVRRQETLAVRLGDSEALRLELAEIEAQSRAGTLPEETAETLRAETIRRFLAEAPQPSRPSKPLSRRALTMAAIGVAAAVALGASLLYAKLGRPDLTTTAAEQVPATQGAAGADGGGDMTQLAATIAGLEAKVRQAPQDVNALQSLGDAYTAESRFTDAAGAYGRAANVAPQDGELASDTGGALTAAAEGQVTPQAKAAFEAALADDPTDARARYYLAAWKDQQGDHAGAMKDWIALIKSAPPGAPWLPQVRASVEQIAAQRHEDISGKLPPSSESPASAAPDASDAPDASGAQPAPAAGDAAAIQALPPAARSAMISGMVDRLAARLKAQPHDATGWISLMRARMVLNDPSAAATAYHEALAAFAGDAAAKAQLATAARGLGVPGV